MIVLINQLKIIYKSLLNKLFITKIKLKKLLFQAAPFYIIRRKGHSRIGIFSAYMTNLAHIKYANKLGVSPIIDMRHHQYSLYHEEGQKGKVNVWENFFIQPRKDSLDEVYLSSNYILVEDPWPNAKSIINYDLIIDLNERKALHKISKKYLRFNEDLSKKINSALNFYFSSNEKYLGVSYREGYTKFKERLHPVQPPLDQLIDDAKIILKEQEFSKVFLATDSFAAVKKFNTEFKDSFVCFDRPRVGSEDKTIKSTKEESIIYLKNVTSSDEDLRKRLNLINKDDSLITDQLMDEIRFDRENDKHLKACEYIIETVLLSRCQGFLGSISGGTLAALILNGCLYEYEKIYDLGTY